MRSQGGNLIQLLLRLSEQVTARLEYIMQKRVQAQKRYYGVQKQSWCTWIFIKSLIHSNLPWKSKVK